MIVKIAGKANRVQYVNPDHIIRLEETMVGTIVHLSDGHSVTIDIPIDSVFSQLTNATPSIRELINLMASKTN